MTKIARAPEASTADPTSASDDTSWMQDYQTVEADTASPDRLDNLRTKAEELREKLIEKADLEARLTEINIEIEAYKFQKLPEFFVNAKVPGITLAPEGNKPGFVFNLDDYIYANIKAEWPPEQRQVGFATVRELEGGDIIKNTYILRVGRKSDRLAQRILKGLRKVIEDNPKADITLEIKEDVPWNTLTAWLKELVNKGKEITSEQLDRLNGKISKQVKVKEIKPESKPQQR